jgi:hypothetical protein
MAIGGSHGAIDLGFVTGEEFDSWIDPRKMIFPDRQKF